MLAFNKANHHRPEWIFLLIILSFVKTNIIYLFEATTVFTVISIGGMQIHLDDIILIWILGYCCFIILMVPLRKSVYLACTFLLIVPICISLIRGVFAGTVGSAAFLSDTRKYILFIVSLLGTFLLLRNPYMISRFGKYEVYIHRLMSAVLVYVLILWTLDLLFGINSLPGQYNGTLSDGGSSFRIINPPQAIMIALYTLWQLYKDFTRKQIISIRTLILIAVVILLQWRTVIAAFLIGMALVTIKVVSSRKLFSFRLVSEFALILVLGGVISYLIDISYITSMLSNLISSFANINNRAGTFATRKEVWEMLLSSLTGINVLFGRPFGAGNSAGVIWTASAHSAYVDYIMVTGYVGLIFLIIFMLILIIGAYRQKKEFIAIILITLLVYWYAYGFSIEQGAVLGLCLAVLNQPRK